MPSWSSGLGESGLGQSGSAEWVAVPSLWPRHLVHLGHDLEHHLQVFEAIKIGQVWNLPGCGRGVEEEGIERGALGRAASGLERKVASVAFPKRLPD